MADIYVVREHRLGLVKGRKIAFRWAEQVEQRFDMVCTYEEGESRDEVCFSRTGVEGTLVVTKEMFELKAKLGLLVSAFKGRIESEIVRQLDTMLVPEPNGKMRTVRKP